MAGYDGVTYYSEADFPQYPEMAAHMTQYRRLRNPKGKSAYNIFVSKWFKTHPGHGRAYAMTQMKAAGQAWSKGQRNPAQDSVGVLWKAGLALVAVVVADKFLPTG